MAHLREREPTRVCVFVYVCLCMHENKPPSIQHAYIVLAYECVE